MHIIIIEYNNTCIYLIEIQMFCFILYSTYIIIVNKLFFMLDE